MDIVFEISDKKDYKTTTKQLQEKTTKNGYKNNYQTTKDYKKRLQKKTTKDYKKQKKDYKKDYKKRLQKGLVPIGTRGCR